MELERGTSKEASGEKEQYLDHSGGHMKLHI